MQASPIVLTTLAGLSTGLGGALAALAKPSETMLAASAGFAGGVMLTASLADLMPEAIALHNIPEGLAVAVPFACATGSRAKGAVAALVSGLAEPAGAVLAALVLAPLLTPGLLNGIVAVVAGIMLWVGGCPAAARGV